MSASFVYPPNGNYSTISGLMVNYYDYIGVQYTTPWYGVQLTLFCSSTSTSSQWSQQDSANNLQPGGKYYFADICNTNVIITQFPTKCHIKLAQAGGSSFLNGDDFWLYSNTATPRVTYYPTTSLSIAPATSKQVTSLVTTISSASPPPPSTAAVVTTSTTSMSTAQATSKQLTSLVTTISSASPLSPSTAAVETTSSPLPVEMATTSSPLPPAMTGSTIHASSVLDLPIAVQSTTGLQEIPTQTTTVTAVPVTDGSRLSVGANAEIGIGATAAGLFILAILGIFLRRYLGSRRLAGRKPQLSQVYDPPPYAYQKVVGQVHELRDPDWKPAELTGSEPLEYHKSP